MWGRKTKRAVPTKYCLKCHLEAVLEADDLSPRAPCSYCQHTQFGTMEEIHVEMLAAFYKGLTHNDKRLLKSFRIAVP